MSLSPLETLFFSTPHRVCQKWRHFFAIYERHFAAYRDREMTFLEIGASQGGSLQLWKSYFGPSARIIGVDIDPACKRFEDTQVEIYIGDQADEKFLRELSARIGAIDVILDDGGHTMRQQIETFLGLFGNLKAGGIYMCEDVHTSYFEGHGGGYRAAGSFLEFMKRRIDDMHLHYHGHPSEISLRPDFASIAFYDSIVVVEKRELMAPTYVEVGFEAAQELA